MGNVVCHYHVGGISLGLHAANGQKIGWAFAQRLRGFSAGLSGSADIEIECQLDTSLDPLASAASSLPMYEKTNGVFVDSIYRHKMGGYTWVTWIKPRSVFLAYSIDSIWRRACLLADHSDTDGLAMFEHLADIISYAMLALGGIVFHGVVMEYQGRSVILSAPSGTGKTTHANLWCGLGLGIIINGDRALCRSIEGTWIAYGMPWCGSSGICENRQVPIQAIVVLEQHCQNIVKRLGPLEALTRLMPNAFAPKWEPALYNKMLDRLDEIIPAVPIFLLRCRPDEDAVLLLKSALDSL